MSSTAPSVELVSDIPCALGENPLWHPDEQALYWTDIPNGRLYRWEQASSEPTLCYEGSPVGGFTLQADGTLLLFVAGGAIAVWDGRAVDYVVDGLPGEDDGRFNDVIADPMGRVYCGTMPVDERPGRLYRLETDGSIQVLIPEVGLPNGMGFAPDGTTMYRTDSRAKTIFRHRYASGTGAIDGQSVFVDTSAEDGVPDGLTVDAAGYVWSARWGGGAIVRYDTHGREVMRITMEVPKVSSVTFGGADYTEMFVTTAGGDERDAGNPLAGSLFRVRCGVRGVAEFRSRCRLAQT